MCTTYETFLIHIFFCVPRVTSMDFVDSPQTGDFNEDDVVDNGLQIFTFVEEIL